MSKSRAPLLIGATAVGGIGYYLYQAGGEPKVAQKQAESDAYSTSGHIKHDLPGYRKEAEKEIEKYGAQANAKLDSAVGKTKAELQRAEAYAKDAKDATLKKVDEFDRKVEAEAAKAKGGILSWFGGGK